MTFAEVLTALAAGKKVRRPVWQGASFIRRDGNGLAWHSGNPAKVTGYDLLADDWEVVSEPASVSEMCCAAQRRDSAIIKSLEGELATAKRDIAGRDTLNEMLRRELAEAKDYAVDFKATVERLTGERTRSEREVRELRAVISADRAALLRDLDDTRRVRDQRWEDAKQAKAELREAKAAVAAFGRELEANRAALHDAWQRIDAAYKALP